MTDLLDELRELNPVDPARVEVPPAVAGRVARGPRRRPPRASRTTMLAAVALGIGVALAVVLGGGGRGHLSLADKAYAATNGPGVRHWKISIRTFIDGRRRGIVQRQEGWARNSTLHVLLFDGRHLGSDIRETAQRTRSWSAGMNDYIETTTPKRRARGPLALGDPFAEFRRAHRAGRLVQLDATTYRLRADRGAFPPDATFTYTLNPQTALPTSAVMAYTRKRGPVPSAFDGAKYRVVFKFERYERLPDTAANRAKLRLLPHPGAGPSKTDARSVFALLRDGAPPSAEQRRFVTLFADGNHERAHLDPASARRGPHGVVLIAGRGYLGMLAGRGATLATVDTAVKHGLAMGGSAINKDRPMLVVVPDGVRAVRARLPHRDWRTFPVTQNVAALPNGGYRYVMVR